MPNPNPSLKLRLLIFTMPKNLVIFSACFFPSTINSLFCNMSNETFLVVFHSIQYILKSHKKADVLG